MTIDLKDRPICITGASSGIGAATAIACAKTGMPVALLARRADKLDRVAEVIRKAGGRAISLVGDVDSAEDCQTLLDDAEREFGPLYAAFANAGYGQTQPTWSMPLEDVRAMFETNLYGSLNLLRPALRRFAERGEGHALLCSSCLSKLAVPGVGCYSATKAAQDHFGRAMRLELRPKGVAVSTVHPVGTRTEFFETAGKKPLQARRTPGDKRLQPPERVANAIVRQLRRGKGGEVWTSTPARLAFGSANMFPGLADWALGRFIRSND